MSKNRLDKELIEHCAPTLAGIKSANLFSYFYVDKRSAEVELGEVNSLLNDRGVYVEPLLWRENSVLVYTYRYSHLEKELRKPEIRELLLKYGYTGCEVGECIGILKRKLKYDGCFPHEIGVFLGYPIEDVTGFIRNGGKNCECCGLWKVYCNASEKERLFDKLRRCSQIYVKVFEEGRSLAQMTVCA